MCWCNSYKVIDYEEEWCQLGPMPGAKYILGRKDCWFYYTFKAIFFCAQKIFEDTKEVWRHCPRMSALATGLVPAHNPVSVEHHAQRFWLLDDDAHTSLVEGISNLTASTRWPSTPYSRKPLSYVFSRWTKRSHFLHLSKIILVRLRVTPFHLTHTYTFSYTKMQNKFIKKFSPFHGIFMLLISVMWIYCSHTNRRFA